MVCLCRWECSSFPHEDCSFSCSLSRWFEASYSAALSSAPSPRCLQLPDGHPRPTPLLFSPSSLFLRAQYSSFELPWLKASNAWRKCVQQLYFVMPPRVHMRALVSTSTFTPNAGRVWSLRGSHTHHAFQVRNTTTFAVRPPGVCDFIQVS